MSGKCSGCAGDEKGMAATPCSACCGTIVACPLVQVVLYAVPAETLDPVAGPDSVGQTDPPDPYPPKQTIVS